MGGGRGCYAGQPMSFYCSKCRRWQSGRSANSVRRNNRITTAGRTRKQRSEGMNYHRWPDTAYQYKCLGCGHIGWSRHPDVQRLHNHEHGENDDERTGDERL